MGVVSITIRVFDPSEGLSGGKYVFLGGVLFKRELNFIFIFFF